MGYACGLYRAGDPKLSWLASLGGLLGRGLSGVELVISDAHSGLVDAIASALPGATWQRCRTHFMTDLLTCIPKTAQLAVATLVRLIFAQPDADSVRQQHRAVVDQLSQRFPEAAQMLNETEAHLLAFARSRRWFGSRSSRTIRWSASTRKCVGEPTWSGSSRIDDCCSGSPPVRC